MSMSPRLLRPRQTMHPEAAAWKTAVVANGGSVSGTTLSAVDKFCNAIASAGIRDRFYRLNLFCGTGLNAALVPLYRGPSLGGTQYGNTTDTNVGPFVSGDYAETGASGGLTGNGTSKYLNTGVPMNFAGLRGYHLSAYVSSSPSGNAGLIGADTINDGVSPRAYQALVTFTATPRIWVWYNIATTFVQADSSSNAYAPGLITGVGSATANAIYAGSSAVGSAGAATNETVTRTFPIFVFAINNRNSVVNNYANVRLGGYSLGLAMNASQVSAYNSAMAAFNSAMGRA